MTYIISFLSSSSFQSVFQWAIHHSYPILLIGMILEGPILIMAASFAASLGYLSLPVIFGLAILGDVIGDVGCYVFGYFSRITVINRFGHYFGVTPNRMARLKALLERHPVKILTAIKISPIVPVPGLIVAGSSHMAPRTFISSILIIILPKTIVFIVIGFFFGGIYEQIRVYLNSAYTAVIISIALVGAYYAYRRISARIATELEQ